MSAKQLSDFFKNVVANSSDEDNAAMVYLWLGESIENFELYHSHFMRLYGQMKNPIQLVPDPEPEPQKQVAENPYLDCIEKYRSETMTRKNFVNTFASLLHAQFPHDSDRDKRERSNILNAYDVRDGVRDKIVRKIWKLRHPEKKEEYNEKRKNKNNAAGAN